MLDYQRDCIYQKNDTSPYHMRAKEGTLIKTSETYLGSLCKRGHNFNGTGKSLRYSSNWDCIECELERNREKPERARERVSRWSKNNPEKKRAWGKNNPDRVKEANRKWQQANHTRTAQITQTRRARKQQNGTRRIPDTEIEYLFKRFGYLCAWCIQRPSVELDHVVSIKNGGYHGLGNLLPSCLKCNRSKGTREPWTWYRKQKFYDDDWEALLKNVLAIGEEIDKRGEG